MSDLKEKIEKLRYVYQYLNEIRFRMIFIKFEGKYDLKELYKISTKGLIHFIENAPSEMIDEMLTYHGTLDTCFKHHVHNVEHIWLKYIFTRGGKTFTEEVDVSRYEGNKMVCHIHETAEEIVAICRLADEIDIPRSERNGKSEYIKIYEGDIIAVNDDWSSKRNGLVLALISDKYTSGDSYYVDLLFTEKYGYLKSDGEPNTDKEPLVFNESIYNVREDRYNYHHITLCSDYKILGNVATHLDILKPIVQKK